MFATLFVAGSLSLGAGHTSWFDLPRVPQLPRSILPAVPKDPAKMDPRLGAIRKEIEGDLDRIIQECEKTIELFRKRGFTDEEIAKELKSLAEWKKIRDDLRRVGDRPPPKK